MAKLSFVQFFIAALVLSAMYVWPRAEASGLCHDSTDFPQCTNEACVAKCTNTYGGFVYYEAFCKPEHISGHIFCECYYYC
ncbi:hypothetical protein NL676_017818 [Syzygium grande]|nr:hypothetical protein NL676_017818 [Syzygium grande]